MFNFIKDPLDNMLCELGRSINDTLQKLLKSDVTDEVITNTVREVMRELIRNNVSTKCVTDLRINIDQKIREGKIASGINKSKWVYNIIFDELVNLVDCKKKPFKIEKGKSQIVIFVGLQGSGKTTSICKYANYWNKKRFKTGIVCADTFRAGAFEQVKQNALKINVPFFGSSEIDPVKVALQGVEKFKKEKFDLILIDTSGRHTQENDLFNEMDDLVKSVDPDNIIFVIDAGIGQSAEKQASGFKQKVNLGSIILSKIDGAEKGGGALTSIAITRCPIEFLGNGEGMDDFEVFEPKRFINRILGKGDLEGLAEKMKDMKFDEKELIKKIKSGNYTMKDFSVHLQQIMALGPLSKIMSMFPGMANLPISDNGQMKKMVCIFDSMTDKELESDTSILKRERTRITRIAYGSGTHPKVVLQLISQFEMMSGLMKKLKNNQSLMNLLSADMDKMSPSEKARLRQNASGFIPKNLLDRMQDFFQ